MSHPTPAERHLDHSFRNLVLYVGRFLELAKDVGAGSTLTEYQRSELPKLPELLTARFAGLLSEAVEVAGYDKPCEDFDACFDGLTHCINANLAFEQDRLNDSVDERLTAFDLGVGRAAA